MQQLLIIIFFLLAAGVFPVTVHAEGPTEGGTRVYVNQAPFGVFTVNSFAAPNPPTTTDNLWVTVEIRDNGRAVRDARVWVTVRDTQRDYTKKAEATHELAPAEYDYTVAIPVPEESTYEVLIEMEHVTGNASTGFIVGVTKPLTSTIFLMLLGPALLIVVFLIHRFVVKLPAPAAVLAGDDALFEKDHRNE